MTTSPSNPNHPFSLTGRRALITGGTQGVGAAIAVGLARAGLFLAALLSL